MTGLNIMSFSYIQDAPPFLFAAINKTSPDILKLSIFVQSVLVCQTEAPMTGLSQAGGLGGFSPPPPQFLTDQLTLLQPGGAHYPHPVLKAPRPRIFRPCDGPVNTGFGWADLIL